MSLVTTCQFIGADKDPIRDYPVMMCGCKTITGKSYCGDHYWKVYSMGSAVNGRRAEKAIQNEIEELKHLQEVDNEEEIYD